MGIGNARRRAHRSTAALPIIEPPKLWTPPDPFDCDPPEQSDWALDLRNRFVMRIVTFKGRKVDYAFVHQTITETGAWAEVTKIDCCHSEVHRHQRHRQGRVKETRTLIRKILSLEDVEDTYDDSFDEVIDNYEENLRRWEHGYTGPAIEHHP